MTCIIGYLDKKNDCVWIGCDSCGSNGYTKSINTNAKAFHSEKFPSIVMGSTSTFRHIDLLKYSETLFDEVDWYKKTDIDHKYMVTKFIPNCIKLFTDGIKSGDIGANFIVGAQGNLFEVQQDFSVLQPSDGFCSVGCGEDVAVGSLITTKDMNMEITEKIKLALIAAEHTCEGVQRPFRIINTKDDKEIIIE